MSWPTQARAAEAKTRRTFTAFASGRSHHFHFDPTFLILMPIFLSRHNHFHFAATIFIFSATISPRNFQLPHICHAYFDCHSNYQNRFHQCHNWYRSTRVCSRRRNCLLSWGEEKQDNWPSLVVMGAYKSVGYIVGKKGGESEQERDQEISSPPEWGEKSPCRQISFSFVQKSNFAQVATFITSRKSRTDKRSVCETERGATEKGGQVSQL